MSRVNYKIGDLVHWDNKECTVMAINALGRVELRLDKALKTQGKDLRMSVNKNEVTFVSRPKIKIEEPEADPNYPNWSPGGGEVDSEPEEVLEEPEEELSLDEFEVVEIDE